MAEKTVTITLAKSMNFMEKNKAGKLVQVYRKSGDKVTIEVKLLKQHPDLDAKWKGWGRIAAQEIAGEALAEGRRERGEPGGDRKVHRIAPPAARNAFLKAQSVPEPGEGLETGKAKKKKTRAA